MSSRSGGDVSIDMDSMSDRQRYQQQLQLIEEQVELPTGTGRMNPFACFNKLSSKTNKYVNHRLENISPNQVIESELLSSSLLHYV